MGTLNPKAFQVNMGIGTPIIPAVIFYAQNRERVFLMHVEKSKEKYMSREVI